MSQPIPGTSALIEAIGVHKSYNDLAVLEGIDIAVSRGECLCVIGPSGSGKSTLLRCFNLLEPIQQGRIMFEGQEIANLPKSKAPLVRQRIGMVFQNFELFQHLSARENVALAPIRVSGMARNTALERAQALLEKVHLPTKGDAYPDELSGGQQQRVAIARALAMEPVLMLYDEPTSALDPETVGEVLQVMQELAQERRTSVVVTHEMGFARRAADRVAFIDAGRVVYQAPPAQFFSSTAETPERLKRFLGTLEH